MKKSTTVSVEVVKSINYGKESIHCETIRPLLKISDLLLIYEVECVWLYVRITGPYR